MNFITRSVLAGARFLGYDIVKRSPDLSSNNIVRLMHHQDINVLLDVGANEGQYAQAMISNGFSEKVISFEPLSAAHEVLIRNTEQHENWVGAQRCAVGKVNEEVVINVSENLVSSSILNIKDETVEFAPDTKYVGREKVNQYNLDFFLNTHFSENDRVFLKMDVQGLEKQVLEGATKTLNLVQGIQFETSLFQLYDNEPVLQEMLSYVGDLGFELYDIIPGYRDASTNRLTQVDCIFVRQ